MCVRWGGVLIWAPLLVLGVCFVGLVAFSVWFGAVSTGVKSFRVRIESSGDVVGIAKPALPFDVSKIKVIHETVDVERQFYGFNSYPISFIYPDNEKHTGLRWQRTVSVPNVRVIRFRRKGCFWPRCHEGSYGRFLDAGYASTEISYRHANPKKSHAVLIGIERILYLSNIVTQQPSSFALDERVEICFGRLGGKFSGPSSSLGNLQGPISNVDAQKSRQNKEAAEYPEHPISPIARYRHAGEFGDSYGLLCIFALWGATGFFVLIGLDWIDSGRRIGGWVMVTVGILLDALACTSGAIGCLPWNWIECLNDGQQHSHNDQHGNTVTHKLLTRPYFCNTLIAIGRANMANVLSIRCWYPTNF